MRVCVYVCVFKCVWTCVLVCSCACVYLRMRAMCGVWMYEHFCFVFVCVRVCGCGCVSVCVCATVRYTRAPRHAEGVPLACLEVPPTLHGWCVRHVCTYALFARVDSVGSRLGVGVSR